MNTDDWVRGLLASIDAKSTEGFLAHLTSDALFRYGSGQVVSGHAAIGKVVESVFASFRELSHLLLRVWHGQNSLVCQGEVRYTLHDGRVVTLPFCNVFELRGSLICRYQIYIDPTPLAAPP